MSDLMILEDNLLPVPLTDLELHQLAMNIVGKELEKDSFEFLSVNSKLKKDPQFVCLKNKKLFFIIVKAILYPENPKNIQVFSLEKLKSHALKFDAALYYAGVGLANSENYELPIFKDSDYVVNFKGIEKLS
jgi:hypothetical protein